jgi:molybdate transport system regulatory protein
MWARIRHSEERLGFPLVETHAGRGPDSGTQLTGEGEELLQRFTRLHEKIEAYAERAFAEAFDAKADEGAGPL